MNTLAENVRTARRFNGWTQEQLAERAGVSQTTIDKIEQGRTLKSRFLPNIALALDVPLEVLDPAMAKARDEWNERLKKNPENFYVMKTFEELPMHSIEPAGSGGEIGIYIISKDPISKVPAPRWIDGTRSLCIYWNNDAMSPEIEAGDAVFFDLGGPIYAGKTGLFMSAHPNEGMCFLARLIMADEESWTIKLIKQDVSFKISIKEWPLCAPLRVRYCNDPGEKFKR